MPDTLLDHVRRFVDEELLPAEPALLALPWREAESRLDAFRDRARSLGIFAPHLPAAMGGLGLSLDAYAPISEALGRSPFGHYTCNCQAPDVGNIELLHAHGSPAQQAQWLAPLARGSVRSCFAMTEPDRAGSNPVWLDTTAVREGDHYRITGRKWFTTAADGAAFTIVMAVTNPEAAPHARASMLLVPMESPGLTVVRNLNVMGESGGGWASHAELTFADVRVPITARIGAEGSGFTLAQERLGPGRIHHAMRWIGISERALALMCQRAVSRELAPGHPLAEQQVVRHWIAESRAEIHGARLMVLDAAAKIVAEGASAARDEIAMLKWTVAGVLQRVLDRAIQTWGAAGLTDATPLAWWYRHERAARIYDGADEVHKDAVARRVLRPYGG